MHETAVPECEGGEQNSGSHHPQKAVAASEYSETGGGDVRRQHQKAWSHLRTDGSEHVRSHSGTEEVSGTGGAQVVHVPAPPRPGPHALFFADIVLDLRLEVVTIKYAAATQKTTAKRRSCSTDGAPPEHGGSNHHRRGTSKTMDLIDRHGTHDAPSAAAKSNSRTGHRYSTRLAEKTAANKNNNHRANRHYPARLSEQKKTVAATTSNHQARYSTRLAEARSGVRSGAGAHFHVRGANTIHPIQPAAAVNCFIIPCISHNTKRESEIVTS